jgi:RNA polymerase sigma factor (sigma-70 family)
VLTPEYVVQYLERAIRKLIQNSRATKQSTLSEDDVFQDILLTLITPSATLGSNYLQRYDPARCYASTYVLTMVTNHLRGLHRREVTAARYGTEVSLTEPVGRDESEPTRLLDVIPEPTSSIDAAERRLLQQQIIKALYKPEHRRFFSTNSRGVGRSTARIGLMILVQGMDVTEVAEALEVTPAEVRRRLRILREDPDFQRFLDTQPRPARTARVHVA